MKTTSKLVIKSISLKTIPVEICDAQYELREMTGIARDAYNDLVRSRTSVRTGDNGKTEATIGNTVGLRQELIAACLFKDEKAVPSSVIAGWPEEAVAALYEACRDLNGMAVVSGEEGDGKNA